MCVDEHDGVGVDTGRDLLENQVDRLEQVRAHSRATAARFGQVRVECRLERRVVGQRLGLGPQLALATRLDGREQPLRRLEARCDRLTHFIPYAEGDDDKHHGEKESDGGERHRQGLDEQPRRPPFAHGPTPSTATGTVKSIEVDLPASTTMRSARSPTRSCHPTIVYAPAGTAGSSNDPLTSGIVKYGWSNTRMVALMCE